ncbi:MAG: carboxypeptidase-like regulatory domain-containing protein [Candidatus Sulfotelmatobacter sp.]
MTSSRESLSLEITCHPSIVKMKWRTIGCLFLLLALAGAAAAQKDEEGPVAVLTFLVIKEDNGKPIRNAAVIMHPVSADGKQSRGGLELKTNNDGRTSFDDVPYGKLRVQVLASGFQTFGEDYDVDKAKLDLTIKLKRPQGQYSIYENHPEEKKDDKPSSPPDPNAKPQ